MPPETEIKVELTRISTKLDNLTNTVVKGQRDDAARYAAFTSTIHGNGQAGIKPRLAVVEFRTKLISWLGGVVVAGIILAFLGLK